MSVLIPVDLHYTLGADDRRRYYNSEFWEGSLGGKQYCQDPIHQEQWPFWQDPSPQQVIGNHRIFRDIPYSSLSGGITLYKALTMRSLDITSFRVSPEIQPQQGHIYLGTEATSTTEVLTNDTTAPSGISFIDTYVTASLVNNTQTLWLQYVLSAGAVPEGFVSFRLAILLPGGGSLPYATKYYDFWWNLKSNNIVISSLTYDRDDQVTFLTQGGVFTVVTKDGGGSGSAADPPKNRVYVSVQAPGGAGFTTTCERSSTGNYTFNFQPTTTGIHLFVFFTEYSVYTHEVWVSRG